MARMLESEEAARRLGVKVSTLYAYVAAASCGRTRLPGRCRSLFELDEVEALARRARTRRPAEARLATVTTAVTQLRDDGPAYRGQPATVLAGSATYESVADLLWSTPPSSADDWQAAPGGPAPPGPGGGPPLLGHGHGRRRGPLRPTTDPRRWCGRPAGSWRRCWPPSRCPRGGHGPRSVRRRRPAFRTPSVATRLTRRCSRQPPPTARPRTRALVLMADHELATSTVAVRVAASTRADLYHAVLSGLGTMAGPLHGAPACRSTGCSKQADVLGPERAWNDDVALRWPTARRRPHRVPARRPPVGAVGSTSGGLADRTSVGGAGRRRGNGGGHGPAGPQHRPGPRRAHLGHRYAGRRGADDLHRGPGGRLDGPLPRGARRTAVAVPGPGCLRHPWSLSGTRRAGIPVPEPDPEGRDPRSLSGTRRAGIPGPRADPEGRDPAAPQTGAPASRGGRPGGPGSPEAQVPGPATADGRPPTETRARGAHAGITCCSTPSARATQADPSGPGATASATSGRPATLVGRRVASGTENSDAPPVPRPRSPLGGPPPRSAPPGAAPARRLATTPPTPESTCRHRSCPPVRWERGCPPRERRSTPAPSQHGWAAGPAGIPGGPG